MKLNLSIAIISYNEERNLPGTLEAIKEIASEIIVVDSFSTDKTVEIANSYGAKVFQEEWQGHIAQKNLALSKCTMDWILALDCDEVVTHELAQSIIEAVSSDKYEGYSLNRRTFYMGKKLKYSWQPDYKLRLVKRSAKPQWGGYDPHDVLMIKSKTGKLKGDLIHYSFKNFADHMQKTMQHAKIAANSYYQKGKKSGFISIAIKPWFVFLNKLLIKRAILDGIPGVISAVSSGVYVYMKYSFLWELQNKDKA